MINRRYPHFADEAGLMKDEYSCAGTILNAEGFED